MANLVNIPGSNATIRAGHYDSLAAAFAQLTAECGFAPVVLSAAESSDGVSGGSRGPNESATGTRSDHYEDNVLGRAAVDIDNQRRIRNTIGSDRFAQIMAAQGWYNIDIAGNAFPEEPWHWATHAPESGSGGLSGTVLEQQRRLNAWADADGAARITEDGIKGPETIGRTKDFQSKHELEPDGVIGPLTSAELAKSPEVTPSDPHPYPGLTEWGTSGTGITIQYQRRLADLGYDVGPLDDDHGTKTTEAITAFQTAKGIQVDGIGGPETWAALWA